MGKRREGKKKVEGREAEKGECNRFLALCYMCDY